MQQEDMPPSCRRTDMYDGPITHHHSLSECPTCVAPEGKQQEEEEVYERWRAKEVCQVRVWRVLCGGVCKKKEIDDLFPPLHLPSTIGP